MTDFYNIWGKESLHKDHFQGLHFSGSKGGKFSLIFCNEEMRMMNGRTDSLLGKVLREKSKACKYPGAKKAEMSKCCLFYSPDLTQFNFFFFCFFPSMKNLLKGSQSETTEEIQKVTMAIPNNLQEIDLWKRFNSWKQNWIHV